MPSTVKSWRPRFGDKEFDALVVGLQHGLSIGEACKAIGFNPSTAYDWFHKHPDKHNELKARMKPAYLQRIVELGEAKQDWRPYAWMCERMFPEEFALVSTTRMEHSGTIENQVRMVNESELARIANVTREIECEVTRDDQV